MKLLNEARLKSCVFVVAIGIASNSGAQTVVSKEDTDDIATKAERREADSVYARALVTIMWANAMRENGYRSPNDSLDVRNSLEALNMIEDKLKPTYRYYYFKGNGYHYLEEYEQAIINYSKAIEMDPKDSDCLKARALSKIAMENFYGAIPDLTKAIALSPDSSALYASRGRCYLNTEEYDKAMIDASKAISMDSRDSYSYITRGAVHMASNRTKEGCLDFTTAGDLGDKVAFELIKKYCTGIMQKNR